MTYKIIGIILGYCLFVSCNSTKTGRGGNDISLNTDSVSNVSEIVEKQEIVTLSNDINAIMGRLDMTQVYDDYYIFRDNKDIIYIFDKQGKFISNSKKVHGKGKGEYYLCLAFTYNKFSRNVELLVPDGILCYDINFHYKRKIRFGNKELEAKMFNYIYDLSENEHLLLSPIDEDKHKKYYIYNSKQDKISYSEEYPSVCSYITMQNQCVSDENFIAFPCVNYSFFEINKDDYHLNEVVSFDFGKSALVEDDFKEKKRQEEIQSYLLAPPKKIPLRTFKSGDRIVMLIKEGSTPRDFKTSFVNLKTKRYTIVRNKDGKDEFPMMDFFSKNILYACVSPEDIGKYVRVNLLDDSSKEIFKMRPKQSNYYVLKYYIK